ncbi:hypothetical protein TWF281_010014 [Arthrobotrys megalospora]
MSTVYQRVAWTWTGKSGCEDGAIYGWMLSKQGPGSVGNLRSTARRNNQYKHESEDGSWKLATKDESPAEVRSMMVD